MGGKEVLKHRVYTISKGVKTGSRKLYSILL